MNIGILRKHPARHLFALTWLSSVIALALIAMPTPAEAATGYRLQGEVKLDGQIVANPNDSVVEGREAFVIVQSQQATIRLTYQIQSAGDELVNTRFIIEKDQDNGWELLLQPSLQAVLGQPNTVHVEADPDNNQEEIEFNFTITALQNH